MIFLIHKGQNAPFVNLDILILLMHVFRIQLYHKWIKLFKINQHVLKIIKSFDKE